jgi:hypothetical protein
VRSALAHRVADFFERGLTRDALAVHELYSEAQVRVAAAAQPARFLPLAQFGVIAGLRESARRWQPRACEVRPGRLR